MIILQNITEAKTAKIAECLKALGLPGNGVTVNSLNRGLVRKFFIGLGFPYAAVKDASNVQLEKAYHSIAGDGLDLIPLLLNIRKIEAESLHDIMLQCWGRTREALSTIGKNALLTGCTADYQEILTYLAKGVETPKVTAPVVKAETKVEAKAEDASASLAKALQTILASVAQPELDEAKIIKLIQKHSIATELKLVTNTGTTVIPTGLHHKKLPEVITMLHAGVNVFMVGAAGSGKTTLAEQAAKALELPFYFNGALDSEYKLTGFVDAQGRIVSTAFRKAYETGGVYLFDEVDASMPSALLAFNAALANGHSDFPDGCIKKHANFHCVAAANTYGKGADRQYVGRNQLDAATLDRFAFVEVDYDNKLERSVCGNDDWCDFVQQVRRAVFGLKIRHVVSPRASINGARLLAAGLAKDTVIDSVVWKGLDKDSVTKIKAAM